MVYDGHIIIKFRKMSFVTEKFIGRGNTISISFEYSIQKYYTMELDDLYYGHMDEIMIIKENMVDF
jgi:hypothetical protein